MCLFADRVRESTPRFLINREKVGELHSDLKKLGYTKGFDFSSENSRDVVFEGDCDDGVTELCKLLGWERELMELESLFSPTAD